MFRPSKLYVTISCFLCIAFLIVAFTFLYGDIRNRSLGDCSKIAIVQHQVFEPYTKAHDSFIRNFGRYYKHEYEIVEDFNAKSDLNVLDMKIAEITSRKDIDLIFSLGTHSTKRIIKATKKIPIVFTITGDPVRSGIVKDWKSSHANFTGVETPDYYKETIRLAHRFVAFKKLGMVYLSGSPSHEAGIVQISKLAEELNFDFYHIGFPLRNENKVPFPKKVIRMNIAGALEKICPIVDMFFVQTSNTFTREFDLFDYAFRKYKVLGVGDTMNIKKGLALGISKDATRFGRQCAEYAALILNGVDPAILPMDIGVKLAVDVNLSAFALAGHTPSFSLISGADNVYE